MMALQTTIRGILGLMVGIAAGAMLGGVLGMVSAGPMGVIGGMVLGAMVGSTIGAGAGLWRNVGRQPVAPRQMAYGYGGAQGRRVQVVAGGD